MKKTLETVFKSASRELTFRQTNAIETDGSVSQCSMRNGKYGFVANNFTIIARAKQRWFVSGQSHHPGSKFKSIVSGEAIRLRRLNEREEDFSQFRLDWEKKFTLRFSPQHCHGHDVIYIYVKNTTSRTQTKAQRR